MKLFKIIIYFNIMDCMMFYWQYLTAPEILQYELGNGIDKLPRWDFGQINYSRYEESVELFKKFKHYINDERANEITRKMLNDLLECCFTQKLTILSYLLREECSKIIKTKKTMKMLNAKKKIKNTLNKLIPKLKTNMIKRQKKEFLKNIESAQLPHDLENLIFTYLY